MFKNINEIKKFIKANEVKFVDFKLVDLQGRFRHLSIPAERLTEQTMKDGIGFDASNYGYANVEKSDMVFIPDLKTAVLDPFSKTKTITMMANVYVIDNPNNRPFNQYPRNIVNAAIEPEVTSLIDFLNQAGANIVIDKQNTIKIYGVNQLNGINFRIPFDRIEAGTYLAFGAMTKGDITIEDVDLNHIYSITI